MNIHDSGYKRLFSNRTIFRQLIETFVEEEWVQLLDFDQARTIDKSFIAEHYKETEADLIYSVPLRSGAGSVLFYLLIEFQSTVERFMSLRTGNYLTNFYMDYWQNYGDVKLLPQIFPIVLYNGSEKWTAPDTLRELIEQAVDLGDFGVQVRHLPIVINTYPLEELLAEANIVSTLFLAEAHYDRHLVVEQLVELFERDDAHAVSLLANWFKQMTVHKRIPAEDYALLERSYRSKEELRTMLVEALIREEEAIKAALIESFAKEQEKMRDQWLEQGIEIGETRSEARAEIKRNRQIARKMAASNYPLATIADLLGISEEDVQHLLADEQPN